MLALNKERLAKVLKNVTTRSILKFDVAKGLWQRDISAKS